MGDQRRVPETGSQRLGPPGWVTGHLVAGTKALGGCWSPFPVEGSLLLGDPEEQQGLFIPTVKMRKLLSLGVT